MSGEPFAGVPGFGEVVQEQVRRDMNEGRLAAITVLESTNPERDGEIGAALVAPRMLPPQLPAWLRAVADGIEQMLGEPSR